MRPNTFIFFTIASVIAFMQPKINKKVITFDKNYNMNRDNIILFNKNSDDDNEEGSEDSGFLDSFKFLRDTKREEDIKKLGLVPEAEDPNDPVAKFAAFMGFETHEKWKAVRYSAYALVIGYLGSELIDQIGADFNNPFRGV